MPKDWGFWNCRTVFTGRVCRMWAFCNKAWPQFDTAETLFLAACLSYLDPSRQEALHLPISYYAGHPFALSLGHRQHNRVLRSGWKTIYPTSLSQFDPEVDNLEVETMFTNH
jgi:hypothetical protein